MIEVWIPKNNQSPIREKTKTKPQKASEKITFQWKKTEKKTNKWMKKNERKLKRKCYAKV